MRNFLLIYLLPQLAFQADLSEGGSCYRMRIKNSTLKSLPLHSLSPICLVPVTVKWSFEEPNLCSKNNTSVGGFGLHSYVTEK